MSFLDFYYKIKPLIPRRIQIAARRQVVRRQRVKYKDIWPIDPAARNTPPGWQGWPEGKQFALVLTHDVESVLGLKRILPLAKLEKEMGFRSSFNFVGQDYPVYDQIRKSLTDMGWEVGLHGLTHKGNLFRSRKVFEKQRPQINQLLKDWGAIGFRAPSMYHHLEWTGDLEIEYDMSTFDSDPFEPQPDGGQTIFPYWVGNRKGGGFVEMPCTLPQDHTLFIIMQEKDTGIWKRKLNWIAEQGGMALINTHPDYLTLNSRPRAFYEYPVRFYEDILNYIKTQYEGKYWHALPREVSEYSKQALINQPKEFNKPDTLTPQPETIASPPTHTPQPETVALDPKSPILAPRSSPLKTHPLNVCMLAYTFYETDGRVKRYAEALAQRGDHVDVVALNRGGQKAKEVIKGVYLHRIQGRNIDEKKKLDYLSRISRFMINSLLFLNKNKLKYDIFHIHSIPDFLVFSALFNKLRGAKIILDIHDLVPELYLDKFKLNKNSLIYKGILFIEKISCRFANQVIIANHLWEKTLCSRAVNNKKVTTFLNYPDEQIFFPQDKKLSSNKKIKIIYPGTLNFHQGLDLVIEAFNLISNELNNIEFHVYGEGPAKRPLMELIQQYGLQDRIKLHGFLPLEEIAHKMAEADLGVVPKRDEGFGGEAFSTKILEFMALGVPIVVSKTRIDQHYFNDEVVKFFTPGDPKDLASKLLELIKDKEERNRLSRNAFQFVEQYKWENNKHLYLDLVNGLASNIKKS